MKITIMNFGPIQRFHYDLSRDIVVTFGDNNIGKSYAMQTVYLLLKSMVETPGGNYAYGYNYGFIHYSFFSGIRGTSNHYDKLKETISTFAKSNESQIDITDQINSTAAQAIADMVISSFLNSCENTFGNFKGILAQKPTIHVEFDNYSMTILLGESTPMKANFYQKPTYLKRATSDFHKSRNTKGKLDIYYYQDDNAPLEVISDQVNRVIASILNTLHTYVGNVYFLPASRSGIYSGMSAFSSIVAELSKNRAMLTRKIELPGISEPISDYFLMLSNVRSKENSAFSDVYQRIEDTILHGKVRFNKSRNTLVYTPDNLGHEFEMTEVSSMVSEISPIVAFLKYIVTSPPKRTKNLKQKPIVFIEEPEAHLHPKNQLKLIELFAELHKYDIKVVISSHSNYIFNKLNNLLLKGDLTPSIYSAILLTQEEAGSVSTFMPMDELGVDDTNFMDVTQALYNEREEIIAAWNEEVDWNNEPNCNDDNIE